MLMTKIQKRVSKIIFGSHLLVSVYYW